MNDPWWDLSRATGIVATILAVAALSWACSSRRATPATTAAGLVARPAQLARGLTLVFVAAHILAAYLDPALGIGVLQVLVPGTAQDSTWAITWGVIATYVLAITVFTTWPWRRFSRPVWRLVHLTSVGGVILAGLQRFQSGTDATTVAFEAGLAIAAARASTPSGCGCSTRDACHRR